VSAGSGRPDGEAWLRRVSALIVAAVAGYASYEHQRRFAVATETTETLAAGPVGVADQTERTGSLPVPATARAANAESSAAAETDDDAVPVTALVRPASSSGRNGKRNAEKIMWAHYERERAAGRTPTGAELDRIAGTNNYGRAVLARWRRTGRLRNAAAVVAAAVRSQPAPASTGDNTENAE
jgi:hypothetical protein